MAVHPLDVPRAQLRVGRSNTAAAAVAPPVTAPSDDEVYGYLGLQLRWVQVLLLLAFALSAWSLFQFSLSSVWLYPMFAVLALNAVCTVLSAFSSFNTRRVTARSHRLTISSWAPDGPMPSVDVFLPTYGEGLDVLANTYSHVAQLVWSGEVEVWVLDDGDRAEVGELAAEFGFHYVVRPDRGRMKKAGNLQYAFGQTSGDHIVIFDADFCPRPDFLAHLVPYMDDPEVGIVQSPQVFDTSESMNWVQRTAGATQELFYRWVLPSRDRFDAAICVGTCALYRRSALRATGGFAQIEHSEDIHTGLFLLRAGFHTRYVPVIAARGLCPSDLAGFLNQQYRWCNGSLVRLENPSGTTMKSVLRLRQKICFWAGVLYYVTTALNVFTLYVPGFVMAAFFPTEVQARQFVPFLLGLWVYLVVMPFVSKGRWRFEVLRIQMAYSFAHAVAIAHKLRGRSAGWIPTGAVGATSSLARTISRVGATTILVCLVPFWAVVAYDIYEHGIRQFWPMAAFLFGYTYLAVPLLVEFVRVLRERPTITEVRIENRVEQTPHAAVSI